MRETRTISISEVKKMYADGISTFSVKDDSVRGCSTVCGDKINVGDKILIDNHFTLVIEDETDAETETETIGVKPEKENTMRETKTFEIENHSVTFTEIKYIYMDETTVQSGLFVHDDSDEFCNGDGIIGNSYTIPETDEEAADILNGEYCETSFEIDSDGIYHII